MKRVVFAMVTLAAMVVLSSGGAAWARTDGGHDGGGHDDGNEVEFTGAIESLPDSEGFIGDWRIAGRTVHVTDTTQIDLEHGSLAVGVQVKVEGQARSDASVDAKEIELLDKGEPEDPEDEVEFKGTIEILPSSAGFIGDWVVGGKAVHVTSSTKFETEHGAVAVGAFVEVKARPRADGSLDAIKIQVENDPQGGDGRTEVKGAIESLPAGGLVGDWVVAGRTIHVGSTTVIDQEHGVAMVGAMVEVTGALNPDGTLSATKIEVTASSGGPGGSSPEGQAASFKGKVETLPQSGLIGDWTISGRNVHVVSSTKLKGEHGALAVGTRVKVKGIMMADGSTVATKIQVRD